MKCTPKLRIFATIILLVAQMVLHADVRSQPGEGFWKDLQELFTSLATARLLPQLDAEQEAEFLLGLMDNLAIPAVITNLAKATAPEPAETSTLLTLSENEGILYLRLNNFQQADPNQNALLEEKFKQQNGRALVLDLRHAQGFSIEAEETHLQFLRTLPIPMLILMDSETAGIPESIIHKLKKERDVLTLGTPSLGIGGAGQEIKLPSGLTLRVPSLEKDQLPGPIEPDVILHESPASTDPMLDPWCRHARDTLKLILTLK